MGKTTWKYTTQSGHMRETELWLYPELDWFAMEVRFDAQLSGSGSLNIYLTAHV